MMLKEFKIFVNDHNIQNIMLCRFLRARKFDLDKTKNMWKNHMEWR